MEIRSRCPECQFLPPLFRFRLPFIWEGLHPQRVMQVLMLGADLPANDIPISWVVGGIWWMPVPAALRWALTPFSHEKSGILTKPSPSDTVSCALEILMRGVGTQPGLVWDLSLFHFWFGCIQITAVASYHAFLHAAPIFLPCGNTHFQCWLALTFLINKIDL